MNHSKRKTEIEAMAKRAGVSIMEYSHTGAGHIGILVEAENGAQRRFSCSRNSGNHRADKNQEAYLRNFARENLGAATPAQQAERAAPATITPAPATTTTATMNNTTTATAATKKVQERRTSHIEFFKLCEWLKIANLNGVYTATRCAELATPALGFPVPISAIQSALEATGIKLPERPITEPVVKRDRHYIIAKELASLMRELGKEPSADLMAIVNRNGAA